MIADMRREQVVVDCVQPATLMRRELFMPGWRATVNGAAVRVSQVQNIFQAVELPVGRNVVRFHFAPVHSGLGWLAFLLGFAGLLGAVYSTVSRTSVKAGTAG